MNYETVVCYPNRLKPSIVAPRKVNRCKFYHYFDQQSSLKTFIKKNIINFPSSLQNFGENLNLVKVVQNYFEEYNYKVRNLKNDLFEAFRVESVRFLQFLRLYLINSINKSNFLQ